MKCRGNLRIDINCCWGWPIGWRHQGDTVDGFLWHHCQERERERDRERERRCLLLSVGGPSLFLESLFATRPLSSPVGEKLSEYQDVRKATFAAVLVFHRITPAEWAAPWVTLKVSSLNSELDPFISCMDKTATNPKPWTKNNIGDLYRGMMCFNCQSSLGSLPVSALLYWASQNVASFSEFFWSFAFALACSRCESWQTCWSISPTGEWQAARGFYTTN